MPVLQVFWLDFFLSIYYNKYILKKGGFAMPAKATCEVKTRTVRQPQKNGDIYVIERQTQYDPVKRYNVNFAFELH